MPYSARKPHFSRLFPPPTAQLLRLCLPYPPSFVRLQLQCAVLPGFFQACLFRLPVPLYPPPDRETVSIFLYIDSHGFLPFLRGPVTALRPVTSPAHAISRRRRPADSADTECFLQTAVIRTRNIFPGTAGIRTRVCRYRNYCSPLIP